MNFLLYTVSLEVSPPVQDFEGELKSISFSRNGSAFGSAFVLSDESITERGLFPHVSTKNMRVTLNFGSEVCVCVCVCGLWHSMMFC